MLEVKKMSSAGILPAKMILNATNQSLRKVSQVSCLGPTNGVAVLNVDNNNLSTLTGVERYLALIQLSAQDNNMVKIEAIQHLSRLVTLNLQGNSISEIAGFDQLSNLQWVSLARNSIKTMSGLSNCGKLNYLDLSENCITELSDITPLHNLKTLLLHGNAISTFQSIPHCLPTGLTSLSMAENEVSDLNEVSFFWNLPHLEELSLLSNPCVSITEARMFDYRPYVLFWCPILTVLDGMEVTQEEKRSSLMLFPPGKPYPFALGEHRVLVHYLTSIHPLSDITLTPSSVTGVSSRKEHVSLPVSLAEASLLELEHLARSSSCPNKSGLMEKIRALQLVEQMIATQHQLMGSKEGDGGGMDRYAARAADEAMAESAISNLQNFGSALDRETVDSKNDLTTEINVNSPQVADGGSDVEPPVKESNVVAKEEGYEQTPTLSQIGIIMAQNIQDHRKLQLKLINEKLARRHSRIPRKEPSPRHAKVSTCFEAPPVPNVERVSKIKEQPKKGLFVNSMQSYKGKEEVKQTGGLRRVGQSTGESNRELIRNVQLPRKNLPVEMMPFEITDGSTSLVDSSLHTPSSPLPLTFTPKLTDTTKDPLPTSQNDTSGFQSDLLESESSFLPVPDNSHQALYRHAISTDESTFIEPHMDVSQDMEFSVSSLLSSLNSAYGYSSIAEKSRLLSNLVGSEEASFMDSIAPEGAIYSKSLKAVGIELHSRKESVSDFDKEAVRIQAVYRGYSARKKYKLYLCQVRAASLIQATWRGFISRRRDPHVMRVRAELSRIKLEAYVSALHKNLQSCKQELVHQDNLIKVHEATIQTLLQEVKDLQSWRNQVIFRESEKASVVLQKYWRGYIIRKKSNQKFCQNTKILVPGRQGLWKMCCSLQKQIEFLLAHSEKGGSFKTNSHDSFQEDLPCAQELQMTHYSNTCVLLRWNPPLITAFSGSNVKKLGYKVYVNGVSEGMVGPDKLKAYIEGLDSDTTYRITVRVIYNAGESKDSNPIIASLDSSQKQQLLFANSTDQTVNDGTAENLTSANQSTPYNIGVVTRTQFHDQLTGNCLSDIQDHTIPSLDVKPNSSSNQEGQSCLDTSGSTHQEFSGKLTRSTDNNCTDVTLYGDPGSLSGTLNVGESDGCYSPDLHKGETVDCSPQSISRGGETKHSPVGNVTHPNDINDSKSCKDVGGRYFMDGSTSPWKSDSDDKKHGQVKPSLDKPTLESVSTSHGVLGTTTTSQHSRNFSGFPLTTSVQATSSRSPQKNASVLPAVTTSPLVGGITQSLLFSPLSSQPCSSDVYPSSGTEHTSSIHFDDTLRVKTKQPPPFSGNLSTSYREKLDQPLPYESTEFVGGRSSGGISGLVEEGGLVSEYGVCDYPSSLDSVKAKVIDIGTNNFPAGSVDIEALQPQSTSQDSLGRAYTTSGAGQCSIPSQMHIPAETTSGKQELFQKSLISCDQAGLGDCKQISQLHCSDPEKCFDPDVACKLPREDTDSIMPLVETTATLPIASADSNLFSHPPVPFTAIEGDSVITVPLICEGGDGKKLAGDDTTTTEMGVNLAESAQIASVLLSQLESDLMSGDN